MRLSGQCINDCVVVTSAVDDAVAELPRRVEPLFIEVNKALLVSVYDELRLQQVMAPTINGHKNCQVLFFIGGQTLIARPKRLTDIS